MISEDHKMQNIHAGIGPHSSMYPCTECTADKNNLHEEGTPRTILSLVQNYEKLNSSAKIKPKDCFSVTHPQLLTNQPEINAAKKVSEFFFPSELHLLLAINHPLKFMKDFYSDNQWYFGWYFSALGPSGVRPYHGGTLEGPQCNALLNNVDYLRYLANKTPDPLALLFVDFFQQFKNIKDSCFGKTLDPSYKIHFENFQKAVENLSEATEYCPPFRISHKLPHTLNWLNNNQIPLGLVSEQGAERLHPIWRRFFSNFPTKDSKSPSFVIKYELSFNRYNSLILWQAKKKFLK